MVTMMWGYGTGGWGMALMIFTTVVFWGALITAIVLATRYLSRTTSGEMPPRRVTPEDILAQRFARGEIGTDEYQARLATLRGRHDHPVGG
ncbi:SHOCT domain-containing protein [Nonomuraea rhodomycinica]|uniref:SHOCT domain-containing protein n=1 Tax=Nonomuraea rhodomycinica TaxID=1712872 RepID=A0A7Y6IUP5_9ACTN|nr:SHOCT domain-containing protein [Nonomuraea rhodomycinica]NUW44726.1 SHOCT domain-containing protein [Nonomuraea rhodomycinica]